VAVAIRPAQSGDAARIGAISVLAWQKAYRGVMSDAFLDGLDPAERTAMWAAIIAAPPFGSHRDVVLDEAGAVAGFAAYGPELGGTPATGELYAVNLDPGSWGHGLGGALIRHVAERLAADGFPTAVLWVATGNARARAVYEHLGWAPDGTARTADALGATVDELRYRIAL
jgi:GNAT superfamily N-acetyltransferase